VIVHSVDDLLAELHRRRPTNSSIVVGIEGASFAGKTTLARQLSAGPNAFRISTDCFRIAGRTGSRYTDGIDAVGFGSDLTKLRSRFDVVVVEGICLRDTLELVNQTADLAVYCKRLSAVGVWNDDPALFSDRELSADCGGQVRIDRWSVEYHQRQRPIERADFIYERVEDE
jgi:hypothetical protein